MGFRTALDTWDSEVLLWAERPVSECCPKAGGFKVPWIQIWEMTEVCHTTGSLQAAVGPRTAITRGNKTESSIQRPKLSKRTSLNCSSFCKSKRGIRNKAQNKKKITRAELWIELDNQVIIQTFNVPLLLPVNEQQEDTRSPQVGMAKASKIMMQKLNMSPRDVKLVSRGAFLLIVASVDMQVRFNSTCLDTIAL